MFEKTGGGGGGVGRKVERGGLDRWIDTFCRIFEFGGFAHFDSSSLFFPFLFYFLSPFSLKLLVVVTGVAQSLFPFAFRFSLSFGSFM
jgi:hypothetical protein